MLTNFQLSSKTKSPSCCGFSCCGNKFGRIERSMYCKVHRGINRIKRSRRYVKHVERQLVRAEIKAQLQEELDDFMDFVNEWDDLMSDCYEDAYNEYNNYLMDLHNNRDNYDPLDYDWAM